MRRAFVHEASLELEPGADERAAGAAVTVALCGHWDHAGACRWPHLNTVARSDAVLVLRVVFAADPSDELEVRARIEGAVRCGMLDGPDGRSRWTLRATGPAELLDEERAVAERLVRHAAGSG
jgi:hypothetical protein